MANLDVEAYFELGAYDLYKVLPVILEDVKLSFIPEFVEAWKADSLCAQLSTITGEGGAQIVNDLIGILVEKGNINGSLQKFVAAVVHQAVLYYAQNPVMPGHFGSTRMHDTMQSAYYWPHVANDVYRWLEACITCGRLCQT